MRRKGNYMMQRRILLEPLDDILQKIQDNRAFRRYDTTSFLKGFESFQVRYKAIEGRKARLFDYLDRLYGPLEPELKDAIRAILINKDETWFTNVGQYLLFNLHEWLAGFDTKERKQEFMRRWITCIIEHENHENVKQTLHVPEWPMKILLELTNNCNLNCIMCGVGKDGYNPDRTMSLNFVSRYLSEPLKHAEWIRLNGLGESTVISNFPDYLFQLQEYNAKLEIVTNLARDDIRMWDAIVDTCDLILISCDSSDPVKYQHIRRGAKFSIFQENLKQVGGRISNPMQAQIIFTLMETNYDDLLDTLRMVSDNGLGGMIVNIVKSDDESWIEKSIDQIRTHFSQAFEFARENHLSLKLPDHVGPYPVINEIATESCSKSCTNPFEEVYIRYNGDLTVCNMLNPYIYGNLSKTIFKELWHGENASLFRSLGNTSYKHHYCMNCYYLK